MGLFRSWKRKKLERHPFPEDWRDVLAGRIPQYPNMPSTQQRELERLVRYFMAEKSFEGCGGMDLDESQKLIIAAMACIPLIGGVSDLYPYLRSVLVYPTTYAAPYSDSGVDGVVTEGVESRSGESWDQGVLIFAWDEVAYDLRHPRDGSNIVFHECAHQLDYEWGATMEDFSWHDRTATPGMATTLKSSYDRLLKRMDRRWPIFVDDYAATNIHEFFAVMTETWLERPDRVQRHWPEVDRVLRDFYNLNPDFL
ncbi:MAG: zinc-dependent peptidase [Cyclonatronaceae bacterium]